MPTVPKAAVAGVTVEASFATFTTLIATFNEERAPSRCLGGWDSVVIVGGSCEEAVRRVGCEEELEAY